MRGTQSPATCNTFVKCRFSNDIRLVHLFRIRIFHQSLKRNAMQASGKGNTCPVTYGSEKINTCVNELRHFLTGILLSGKGYYQRNIHYFFV